MNRQNQLPQQQSNDLYVQLANFVLSIGIYTRFAITLNILVFIAQKSFLKDITTKALIFGYNYQSIVGAHQYYRILTSAFSHEAIAHILFNMCALAVSSVQLEKAYGSFFFAIVNMFLLVISAAIYLLYDHARIFWLPPSIGGGSLETLLTYGIGYSGILFGLIMLFCLTGERYTNVYGCKMPKIFIPFIYLIISKMIQPKSDNVGHISGIIAALLLRYTGIYHTRLLPQYSWLHSLEKSYSSKAKTFHT